MSSSDFTNGIKLTRKQAIEFVKILNGPSTYKPTPGFVSKLVTLEELEKMLGSKKK